MFYSNHRIAIDFGTRYIKMIYGKKTSKGISIIKHGIFDAPPAYCDIVNENHNLEPLLEFVMNEKIKTKNVTIGIKGQDIIIRHIEIPAMNDRLLKQAMNLELKQYISKDLEDYTTGYKKLTEIIHNNKKILNILLVAVPKPKIYKYSNIINKLGLNLSFVDIFANSMSYFFMRNDVIHKECVALLDIGYMSSTIVLLEDGKLFFHKDINVGSRVMENPTDGQSVNNDTVYLNTLIEEIIKVFNFYISRVPNKDIVCLYLTGGGANCNGIINVIKSRINIEIKLFDGFLFENIDNIDSIAKEDINLYINCLSLLLKN